MKLVALKPFPYNTRQLLPGDPFEASNKDARLLIAIKKAVVSVDRESGKIAPLPPDLAAKVTAAQSASEIEKLQAEAGKLGVAMDRRWGAKRLQSEIDAARKTAKNVPPVPPVTSTADDDNAGQG